jgi:multiple antibiotic resistance protein
MSSDTFVSTLVTLLVTVDPVGLAPIFLSLTTGMTTREGAQVAMRATVLAFGILAFFAVAGEQLLHWLGIGLPAFRIGGGLLLFWIAFEMVFERRAVRKEEAARSTVNLDHPRDVAAFPLAIPLMAGPGAITAVILLSSRTDGHLIANAALFGLTAAVMLACLAVFVAATRVAGLLGSTGNAVLTRLLGVLLTALAVQFVADGMRALQLSAI